MVSSQSRTDQDIAWGEKILRLTQSAKRVRQRRCLHSTIALREMYLPDAGSGLLCTVRALGRWAFLYCVLVLFIACARPEAPPTSSVAPAPRSTATPTPRSTATPTPRSTATLTQLQMVLRVQDGQGASGDVIPIELSLQNATKSIAGFQVTVSVQNRGIARIADVQFADYGDPKTGFGLTAVMNELPAQYVTIAAVDLSGVLKGPFSRRVLATVSVELLSPGETQLVASVLRIDDTSGEPIVPEEIAGTLIVVQAN